MSAARSPRRWRSSSLAIRSSPASSCRPRTPPTAELRPVSYRPWPSWPTQVGAGNIDLVTHSTTQAVNALIEGDAGEVGVIGMGRRPDLSRVEKRTRLRSVEHRSRQAAPCPPRVLRRDRRIPGTQTCGPRSIAFRDAGVAAVCVAEAFSPDDPSNEIAVAALANELGLPVCTSTDLSGLYGLELRTITAALNASILPIAVSTASFVADGVKAAGIEAPVMVMRSDGGATDLDGFSAAPVRTLYSGPSASVAGALRLHRCHQRGRPRGRRDIDEHRRDPRRTPVDVLRARRIACDGIAQSSTCASSVSPAARCRASGEDTSTASARGRHTSPISSTRA